MISNSNYLSKLAEAIADRQHSSRGVVDVGGVAPRGVAHVVEAHVARTHVVKLAQNGQPIVDGVSALDADHTGDFASVERVPNS